MVELSISTVKSVFKRDEYKLGTGFAGFYFSVISKYIPGYAQNKTPVISAWAFSDFIANLFGPGIAKAINPSWTGGAQQSFTPFKIFNKALFAVVGLEILDSLVDGQMVDTLKAAIEPALIGYAIGQVFDPAPRPPGPGGYPGVAVNVASTVSDANRALMVVGGATASGKGY
jgi:hypothetical protein